MCKTSIGRNLILASIYTCFCVFFIPLFSSIFRTAKLAIREADDIVDVLDSNDVLVGGDFIQSD